MLLCKWKGFFFKPLTNQAPTKRPTDHQTPTIHQLYQPPTNRPLTNKTFEEQRNITYVFDINYYLKNKTQCTSNHALYHVQTLTTFLNGILYKADPKPDLEKKQTPDL